MKLPKDLPEELKYEILEYSPDITTLILLSKKHHNKYIIDNRYFKLKVRYYYKKFIERIRSLIYRWTPN